MPERLWRKENSLALYWWGCKLIQPLWRTAQRFLKKLGIKPPNNPAVALLGKYPEETIIEKDMYTSWHFLNFISCSKYRCKKLQSSTERPQVAFTSPPPVVCCNTSPSGVLHTAQCNCSIQSVYSIYGSNTGTLTLM